MFKKQYDTIYRLNEIIQFTAHGVRRIDVMVALSPEVQENPIAVAFWTQMRAEELVCAAEDTNSKAYPFLYLVSTDKVYHYILCFL